MARTVIMRDPKRTLRTLLFTLRCAAQCSIRWKDAGRRVAGSRAPVYNRHRCTRCCNHHYHYLNFPHSCTNFALCIPVRRVISVHGRDRRYGRRPTDDGWFHLQCSPRCNCANTFCFPSDNQPGAAERRMGCRVVRKKETRKRCT